MTGVFNFSQGRVCCFKLLLLLLSDDKGLKEQKENTALTLPAGKNRKQHQAQQRSSTQRRMDKTCCWSVVAAAAASQLHVSAQEFVPVTQPAPLNQKNKICSLIVPRGTLIDEHVFASPLPFILASDWFNLFSPTFYLPNFQNLSLIRHPPPTKLRRSKFSRLCESNRKLGDISVPIPPTLSFHGR